MGIRFIYLDVANTLLEKPALYPNIQHVLETFGHTVPLPRIRQVHRQCSEAVHFPSQTNAPFYQQFNARFLQTLGIAHPDEAMVDAVYQACRGLPWAPFVDTEALEKISGHFPMGILSNWDLTLNDVLASQLPYSFAPVLGSKAQHLAKPDPAFFQLAIEQAHAQSGVEPHEILMVGDSIRLDMEPALAAGMQAVLVDRDTLFVDYTGWRVASLHKLVDVAKGLLQ